MKWVEHFEDLVDIFKVEKYQILTIQYYTIIILHSSKEHQTWIKKKGQHSAFNFSLFFQVLYFSELKFLFYHSKYQNI